MTFQVDNNKFDVTRDVEANPCLKTIHDKIKDHFGISWSSVEWRDLRRPLYSGLAARLYLETITEVFPEVFDFATQARYWKSHYNTNPERNEETFKKDLTRQPNISGQGVVHVITDMIKESAIFPDDKGFLRRTAHVESNDGMNTETYREGFHGGIWQVFTVQL